MPPATRQRILAILSEASEASKEPQAGVSPLDDNHRQTTYLTPATCGHILAVVCETVERDKGEGGTNDTAEEEKA